MKHIQLRKPHNHRCITPSKPTLDRALFLLDSQVSSQSITHAGRIFLVSSTADLLMAQLRSPKCTKHRQCRVMAFKPRSLTRLPLNSSSNSFGNKQAISWAVSSATAQRDKFREVIGQWRQTSRTWDIGAMHPSKLSADRCWSFGNSSKSRISLQSARSKASSFGGKSDRSLSVINILGLRSLGTKASPHALEELAINAHHSQFPGKKCPEFAVFEDFEKFWMLCRIQAALLPSLANTHEGSAQKVELQIAESKIHRCWSHEDNSKDPKKSMKDKDFPAAGKAHHQLDNHPELKSSDLIFQPLGMLISSRWLIGYGSQPSSKM